jgi:hypothetical protein
MGGVERTKGRDMNGDQKGFLAALVVFVVLIVVVPIVYLIVTFSLFEYGRPSAIKIKSLEGKSTGTALQELKDLEFGCKENTDQRTSKWTCWADEEDIGGPCHWTIEFSANAKGIVSKVEILKSDGQCKR